MVKNWFIGERQLDLLRNHLFQHKPKMILELGSGKTTALISHYCFVTKSQHLSLEHDPMFYKQTKGWMQQKGGLVLAPLKPNKHGLFYDYNLPDGFDFVLIDGPPMKYGRLASFYEIYPHLVKNFTVWLDDRNRQHEMECLAHWTSDFPISVKAINDRLVEICPAQ